VTQAVGLLLSGLATAGVLLTDSLRLLLACWTIGAVLHVGLAAAARSQRTADAARQAFLAEILGAWCLAMGGLSLALAAGTGELDLLPQRLAPLDQTELALPWAGVGVLLAVAARLGLPPLPAWSPRLAGAPPAVRVVLHAGLHPATALLLWQRVDLWVLPWHRTTAVWLGTIGAVALILAAAGERHGARRAAWLGASLWASLFAATAGGPVGTSLVWLLVGALALVEVAVAVPRLSLAWRRALLPVGVAGAIAVVVVGSLSTGLDPAAILRLGAALVALWVLRHWLGERPRPEEAETGAGARRPPIAMMAPLARLGQGPGLAYVPLEWLARVLGRLAAEIDRVVLDGIVEGLGWIGLGLGWFAAWADRRGLDLIDQGTGSLAARLGHGAAGALGRHPARVLVWAVVAVLALILLWRTAG